ncbi:MAG: DUF2092 domain-containing protein [Gammaproteobacteria bacterium]
MQRQSRSAIVLAVTLLILASGARADDKAAVDPAAMTALQKMGTYLRTLTAFQVEAATTDEDVLDSGLKIQYGGTTRILARMPARLRAEVENDRNHRLYLYDGKTFTLFAKRLNYYATVPAPPTIGQLADKLDESYDVPMPLEDLFRWGTPGSNATAIKAAIVVGPSDVAGTTCEQYAFHQDDVDWQVWIQRGDYPLPRRLVITTNTDEAKPQHTAVYTWNLAPSYNDAAFTFKPPSGAQRVALPGNGVVVGSAKPAGTKSR